MSLNQLYQALFLACFDIYRRRGVAVWVKMFLFILRKPISQPCFPVENCRQFNDKPTPNLKTE